MRAIVKIYGTYPGAKSMCNITIGGDSTCCREVEFKSRESMVDFN